MIISKCQDLSGFCCCCYFCSCPKISPIIIYPENSMRSSLSKSGQIWGPYFASKARAKMPAARGAEAEVPVWVSVQSLCRSALVWKEGEKGRDMRSMRGATRPRSTSAVTRKLEIRFSTSSSQAPASGCLPSADILVHPPLYATCL